MPLNHLDILIPLLVTSSSVLVNLPAALLLVVILRYFSLDFEMRRKAIIYKSSQTSKNTEVSSRPPVINKTVDRSEWKRKVNSPHVEKALDQFTRHLVSEWVTDLWYSRITPDKEGPEELVHLINGVLGELSFRMKNINLIDLLTRDIINMICSHLKVFRVAQAKMKTPQLGSIALESQDRELKVVLAAEDKLHPALFSPEAEHKVLQHLISGLISCTFKSEDLQCSYFRYTVRELIACAVMRPVVNLANPRFINERIENVVTSRMKASKGSSEASDTSQSKAFKLSRLTADLSLAPDDAVTGVELVPLKEKQLATNTNKIQNKDSVAKDPLLSVDTRSSRSWSSMPSGTSSGEVQGILRQSSGGEWGDVLDKMSHRKTQALAPENIENMWAKGRNFKKNESLIEQVPQKSVNGMFIGKGDLIKTPPLLLEKNDILKARNSELEKRTTSELNGNKSSNYVIRKQVSQPMLPEESEISGTSSSSYTSEDEEANTVTGLDSPEIKVWDSKKNKNVSVDRIHHPLESFDGHSTKKSAKGHASRAHSGRKRFKVSSKKVPSWKEVQRTSFLSGDGQDILNPIGQDKNEESSDEHEVENLGRLHSNLTASSSASFLSVPDSQSASGSGNHAEYVLLAAAFLRLRCEVAAANIVRSDSGTFAVYSIYVTDVNNNNWSIKRRFKHFEELHRRLKEYPEYNLPLPPKHFLTTGLDMSVIQERSQLLDKYLKRLMQLPTVSSAVEVWDFLSVDSQTYTFSNSFSIIETLQVRHDNLSSNGGKKATDYGGSNVSAKSKDPITQITPKGVVPNSKVNAKQQGHSQILGPGKDSETRYEDPDSDLEIMVPKKSGVKNLASNAQRRKKDGFEGESRLSSNAADPAFPAEWVPPNLSVPLLDLVDVILHIEDGGWIRRKAFWVAKQLLHLGMGDALDDWLLEKIQRLRQGSLVASGIGRVEQILWPDGIFITKHPKRQRPPNASPAMSPSNGRPPTQDSPRKKEKDFEEQQRQEADRRARLVYELMIDKAPAAVVSVIGRKEYEHCVKDLYFFIQSAVCLKQLAFELIELLLLSAFPELDQTMKELHEQKHKFGELLEN